MTDAKPRLRRTPDELILEDSTWLSLGRLRALVARAGTLGWPDNSLVSHGPGTEHPYRHDVRITRRLVAGRQHPGADTVTATLIIACQGVWDDGKLPCRGLVAPPTPSTRTRHAHGPARRRVAGRGRRTCAPPTPARPGREPAVPPVPASPARPHPLQARHRLLPVRLRPVHSPGLAAAPDLGTPRRLHRLRPGGRHMTDHWLMAAGLYPARLLRWVVRAVETACDLWTERKGPPP